MSPDTEQFSPAIPFEELKRKFKVAIDATQENNQLSIRDRDYYDGDQLSDATKRVLNERGQPLIWTNRIERAISGILGVIDAGENSPQAYPRTPSAADAADVATKTLRFLAERAEHKRARRAVSADFMIQGSGAAVVQFKDDTGVTIEHIRWDEFFYDPFSRDHDFRDARYLGTAMWLDVDSVSALYPETFAELGDPFSTDGDLLDSKSDDIKRTWLDPQRKRLRVVDLYYRDSFGAWHRAIFCNRGILWAGPSEYRDDQGRSICPIEATSYEVKQNGDRYGAVRNMIPLQEEVNSRRSKALHLMNNRQVQQTTLDAPAANKAIAKREAAKADGVFPYGWQPLGTGELSQGQMQLLIHASEELDRMAPTPAVLGRVTNSRELGRARQMLQQAGLTEMARAVGRLEEWEERIYRQLWFRARQFLTDEMFVRITSDPRTPEFLKINEPVMGVVPMTDPATGQTMMVPAQIGTKNALAEMDMDIILATVPSDALTVQMEVFTEMLNYAGSLQISPLDPKFRALLKVSPIPNKTELIEQLEAAAAEVNEETAAQQQAQAAMMQQAQQIEMGTKQARAAKEGAQAMKAGAEAERIKLETEAFHVATASRAFHDGMAGQLPGLSG